MTDLVKSPCVGCWFAEWNRTKSGKLHPTKTGRCHWRPKIEPMPWWTQVEKKMLTRLTLGWISSDDVPTDSSYATCDAREEA